MFGTRGDRHRNTETAAAEDEDEDMISLVDLTVQQVEGRTGTSRVSFMDGSAAGKGRPEDLAAWGRKSQAVSFRRSKQCAVGD